jgi:hypothetical protein
MPSESYDLVYDARIDKAVTGIDKLIAKIHDLDKVVDESEAKMKKLGNDTPGLTNIMTVLARLRADLGNTDHASGALTASIKRIGTNTQLAKANATIAILIAELAKAEAQAKQTQAALASMQVPPGVGAALGGGGGTTKGLASKALIGGAFVATAIRSGTKAVGESGQTERTYNAEVARKAIEYRSQLRETATLRDKTEVDDNLILEQLEFQEKTATKQEDSLNFKNQFLGAVEAGKKRGNITDQVADELMVEGATFAARTEMDAGTAGKLVGLMPNSMEVGSKQKGMSELGQMQYHLNKLGVNSVRNLTSPMVGLMAEMVDEDGGRVETPSNMAAILAASTTATGGSPGRSMTQVKQSNRVLRKMAASGIAEITMDDDYLTAMGKAARFLTAPNADQWMQDNKLGNRSENEATVRMAKLLPVIKKEIADPKAQAFGDSAISVNQQFRKGKLGQANASEARLLSSEIRQGMKSERVEILRNDAEARLKDPTRKGGPGIDTTATGIADAWTYISNAGGVYGRDERIDQEVIGDLTRRAKEAGIDPNAKLPNGETVANALGSAKDTSGQGRGVQSLVKGIPTSVDERRRETIDETSKLIEAAEKLKEAAEAQIEAAKAANGPIAPRNAVGDVVPKR